MKFLAIFLSFFIGLIVFMPKENLFFTLQKTLQKENIYINTNFHSNITNLYLENSKLFINGINIASIKQTNILPLILFNQIKLNNIKIDFNNLKIDNLSITYSIINPLDVEIKGESSFATIKGNIDLKNQTIKVYLINLTNNSLKPFLRKDKKGYFYAQKF